jgi:orotate phosphoribosyltransferase
MNGKTKVTATPSRNILKSKDVTLEGEFVLDSGRRPSFSIHNQEAGVAPSGPPTGGVQIAEQQADFAVLEITCGCGAKHYVRCDYGG